MTRLLRAAIVGFGTGGQVTALCLARDGHRVEVFERVSKPGPAGAGFLLQPTGLYVLWQLGLLDAVMRYGMPVLRLFGATAGGRAVMDMRYAELDERLLGVGMQRGALFELLDSAWVEGRCVRAGHDIVEVDPDAGTLTDASGQVLDGYDLIVIADGAGSTLRQHVGTARFDRPYPWGARWCLLPAHDWPHGHALQQRYVGSRRMAGMLPVGSRPGDQVRRLSFFWSEHVSSLHRSVNLPALLKDVHAVWPQAAACLHAGLGPAGLAVARYRDTGHKHWYRGRAVLLGDAAHAMSPQLGQGVNMALLDALVLRDSLRRVQPLVEALKHCQHQRRQHLRAYHFWSRRLTPLFQSGGRVGAAIRDAVLHPLCRMPGSRGQMLRVLTGTRHGWLGKIPLSDEFLQAMESSLRGMDR